MNIVDGSNATVAHLGIAAGLMDSLGIPQYIDNVLPKKRQHKVSRGAATKALILNGLGFSDRKVLTRSLSGSYRIVPFAMKFVLMNPQSV